MSQIEMQEEPRIYGVSQNETKLHDLFQVGRQSSVRLKLLKKLCDFAVLS